MDRYRQYFAPSETGISAGTTDGGGSTIQDDSSSVQETITGSPMTKQSTPSPSLSFLCTLNTTMQWYRCAEAPLAYLVEQEKPFQRSLQFDSNISITDWRAGFETFFKAAAILKMAELGQDEAPQYFQGRSLNEHASRVEVWCEIGVFGRAWLCSVPIQEPEDLRLLIEDLREVEDHTGTATVKFRFNADGSLYEPPVWHASDSDRSSASPDKDEHLPKTSKVESSKNPSSSANASSSAKDSSSIASDDAESSSDDEGEDLDAKASEMMKRKLARIDAGLDPNEGEEEEYHLDPNSSEAKLMARIDNAMVAWKDEIMRNEPRPAASSQATSSSHKGKSRDTREKK